MIIEVNVKPGSKEEKVEKISEKEYKIWVKEKAVDGKANRRLINLLAKKFNVDVGNIGIKNFRGRRKIVEVRNG